MTAFVQPSRGSCRWECRVARKSAHARFTEDLSRLSPSGGGLNSLWTQPACRSSLFAAQPIRWCGRTSAHLSHRGELHRWGPSCDDGPHPFSDRVKPHTVRMGLEWHRVAGTLDWQLVDEQTEQVVRYVAVRGPYANEEGDTRFEVTGDAHDLTVHKSLEDARRAAEASLPPWERI